MISLSSFRSKWFRPAWAVLLAVCVLLKTFTVAVATTHELGHGGHDESLSAQLDVSPGNDGDEADKDDARDPFHRLLHANHCCWHDGLALIFSYRPVWVASPQSPPSTTTTGRLVAHHAPLLRPPRLA